MQTGTAQYDADLQMFVERPREPDPARLGFLRWLAERGRLEHAAAGTPAGEYAAGARPLGVAAITRRRRPRSRREGSLTKTTIGTLT